MSPVILTAAILGQCSGGSCPAPIPIAPSYPVVRVVDEPAPLVRRWVCEYGLRFEVMGVLEDGGRTINWSRDLDFNRRSIASARAEAEAKRRERPAERPAIQNFGLTPERMGLHQDAYTAPSHEARRFVAQAKGEAGEPAKLHVTVIGTEAECSPVVGDLRTHPALAGVRDRLMVQDYRPDEWPVDPRLGFRVNGRPTILIQTARGPGDDKGGKVVHRQMNYEGGPERLAEAIRKADPHYNPALDPGPDRPRAAGCPLGFTSDHWLPIAAAALVVSFIFRRPKVQP